MGSDVSKPAAVTDEQIEAAVRPLYANDAAAKMGLADDIRTARAVLAITRTPEPQAEPQPDSHGQAREGWKLVPVEPTEAMEQFICTCDSRSGAGYTRDGEPVSPSWRTCYASLLAASPTPDEQRAQAAQEDVEATVGRLMRNEVATLVAMERGHCIGKAHVIDVVEAKNNLREALRTALAGRQQL